MPPFRPANLNKRAYPGNASVIGPTRIATLGITTSNVGITETVSCGAAAGPCNILGCRYTHCCCPCCKIVCGCPQTTCNRTVPSGRWNVSEQYEAKKRDAWGPSTCTTGDLTCLCCTNIGVLLSPQCNDCKGFFICCGPSTNKWFVAPACTEVCRTWYCRNDAVSTANSLMGSCGWFIPSCPQLQNPGSNCNIYWDSITTSPEVYYWSNTEINGGYATVVRVDTGNFSDFSYGGKTNPRNVRSFRCTTS